MLPSPTAKTNSDAGRRTVAARIAELAQAHGMKLANTDDLASLLGAIQVSDPIPIAAFAVVAEVLFAVLNANQHQQENGGTVP
jgi:type III secretion system FlhB-like substrate exporter